MNKRFLSNSRYRIAGSSRPRRKGSRSHPELCNWAVPLRCRQPVDIAFESGLGYCREHAETVMANREWLTSFFEKLQRAKQHDQSEQ